MGTFYWGDVAAVIYFVCSMLFVLAGGYVNGYVSLAFSATSISTNSIPKRVIDALYAFRPNSHRLRNENEALDLNRQGC